MEHWSAEEKQRVASLWSKVDVPEVGGAILGRLLVVYPWTRRFFDHFRNLSNPEERRQQSSSGRERQHPPPLFHLLGNILIIVLAGHHGKEFTPSTHADFQKLTRVVAHFLALRYH